jgi:hypothetical protein
MNIALPAIVLFLIALPGFLFRSRLKRTEQTSFDYSPFGRVVTESVLWAVLLHAVWLTITYFGFERSVQVDLLVRLLSSGRTLEDGDAQRFGEPWIALYFGSLYLFAYIIPAACRWLITRFRLDRIDARLGWFFRFNQAPWYYLLTGADFREEDLPDYILVSAVVDVAGNAILYRGVLDDFFFDPQGQLERLVLENVSRRPLDQDRGPGDEEEQFYAVEGDYFVIRYADATTLNIEYRRFPQPVSDD